MKWPWVTRTMYDDALRGLNTLAERHVELMAEHDDIREKLELSQASERAERLKRLRAEGLCQWKDDRIRGALQLLYREESGVKKAG